MMSYFGRRMRGCLIAAAMTACIGAPAAADISAYNAAVQSGDLTTAAVHARDIWKGWDKTGADAPVVGREFAFTALRGGQGEIAFEIASDTLKNAPPPLEIDRKILNLMMAHAQSLGTKNSSDARAEVVRQLADIAAYDAVAGPVVFFVLADQSTAMEKSKKEIADAYYRTAADLWAKTGPDYLPQWLEAEVRLALMTYRRERDTEPYLRLRAATVHFVDQWRQHYDYVDQAQMNAIGYVSAAWLSALWGNLKTAEVNDLPYYFPALPRQHPETETPYCIAEAISKSEVRFKQTGSMGNVSFKQGAAVVILDITEDGKTENVRIAASAPGTFNLDRALNRSFSAWKWGFLEDESAPNCLKAQKNRMIPFITYMD